MTDPACNNPAIAALLPPRLAVLGPGTPNLVFRDRIMGFDLGPPTANEQAARAFHAGLWLYHDFLDESHVISQDLETKEGSFWHAIMHRREPDAGNSKYWWRQVGSHPVLDRLASEAPLLGYTYTSPQEFVDFCERVRGTMSTNEELAMRVQRLEWGLLFDWCYHKAIGADREPG